VTTRRPFREGLMTLEPLRLVGLRCGKCGVTSFPVRSICPACRSADGQNSVTLSDTGSVYSYTIVRQAPPDVEVPYVLAYVDLPEDVRVMAQLDRRHIDEVAIGKAVRLVERPMGWSEDGVQLVGYQFELSG
jgi:uncharacterized OB-fold protein